MLSLVIACFLLNAIAAQCKDGGDQKSVCEANKCEAVGAAEVCARCGATGKVPLNGKCTAVAEAAGKCQKVSGVVVDDNDTSCGKCVNAYFMYKGGCYETTAAPGNAMCKTAAAGVCTVPADAKNYFVPPGADATHDSVVWCGDETGVTLNSKTYKGVVDCEMCDAPKTPGGSGAEAVAICKKCGSSKYLKTDGSCANDASGCTSNTEFGKEDTTNGNKCVSCGDTTNGGIADCSACTYDPKTKKLTCSACTGTKKPNNDGSACEDAPSPAQCTIKDCKTCSGDGKTCVECKPNFFITPTGMCVKDCKKLGNYYGTTDAKSTCKECTVANCKECKSDGTCQVCSDGYHPSTDGCKKCDSSCKTCSGGTVSDCTECPSGSALTYTNGDKGTCGAECTEGTGSTGCKTCGLTVDGTKYCSACNKQDEYPQNGVCSSATTRTTSTCKAGQVANGVCTTCADGSFKMDGGCYETTKFPGKSVCTEAAKTGGTCQKVASGYKLDNTGTLTACPSNCKECTSGTVCSSCIDGYIKPASASTCTPCDTGCATCETNANTCKTCSDGYYLSNSKCIACDKDDSNIQGVPNCARCEAPTGDSGPVLCYVTKSNSTNKSGLSGGAIAGIVIAVIVVVGGLVGFLCWWFICRGK